MLSHQINQKLSAFVNILSSQEYLQANLDELSDFHLSIVNKISTTILPLNSSTGSSTVTASAQNLESLINKTMESIKGIKLRQIFIEITNIEDAYRELLSNTYTVNEQYESGLQTALNAFIVDYDEYLNNIDEKGKKTSLLKFLASASSLSKSLELLQNSLTELSSLYQNMELIPDEKEERLSILLESEIGFSRFLQKISAINIIYAELCTLAGESYTHTSPKIIKIESGSLWVDILGYPKIISLLESILEGSIGYMYRTFTREGKIGSIPRKVESVESILELRKKLKAVGIDTSDLDENLQKASVVIAQETNNLLVGEPKLTLNKRVFTIGAELEKKYLESGRQLFLPDNQQ